MEFFKFHEKLMHGTFLIFSKRLEQQKSRKLGKIIVTEFWFGGFNSSITHFNKKITVSRHYIFKCAWESNSKNLPKIQFDASISYVKANILLLELIN